MYALVADAGYLWERYNEPIQLIATTWVIQSGYSVKVNIIQWNFRRQSQDVIIAVIHELNALNAWKNEFKINRA